MTDPPPKSEVKSLHGEKPASGEWLAVSAIAVFLAAVFISVSRIRFVDGDEGFYLLAAKLVYHGRVLYRDFFFTQMPLTAYAYGAWMQLTGETWNSARLLSALAADALGCLLYLHLARITGSRVAGIVSVFLFTASISTLAWFPIVKTYAFAALFLFAAYLLISEYMSKSALLFAGAFLGLAIDTRLYLVAVAPVFLFCIYWRRGRPLFPLDHYLWFTAGLGLALSPNLYWLVTDPRNYYLNNFGYHTLRYDPGIRESLREKLAIITGVIGIRPYKEGNGLPFGILTILNLVPFVMGRKFPGPRTWPATWIAFAIILVSLVPTPTYYQYFAIAAPFLIPGAVVLIWDLEPRRVIAPALALLVLYLLFLPFDLYRYTVTGANVLGVTSTASPIDWRLDTIRKVSGEIRRLAFPGEVVLSFWPGYLFETDAVTLNGMENHSALPVADQFTADQRRRFHIASSADLAAGLSRHDPCLVILGNQESMVVESAPYQRMLAADGYLLVESVGDTAIYRCR